jgi:autotransporter-associated beta strand protein
VILSAGNAEARGFGSASALTINAGGTVNVTVDNSLFGWNAPAQTVTLNAGGMLTCPANSIHLGAVTLQGGELGGGQNSTWGSWYLHNGPTATGSTTSTISATGMILPNATTTTWTVGAGSTLNVTGNLRGTYGSPAVTSGSLIKAGSGVMIFGGANAYNGTTTVNAGSLLVNGSLGTNTVTVAAGATLGGYGTLNGAVTLNGTISPGVGVGTLASKGQTWNAGGSFVCEIVGTNSTACDLAGITGGLNVQSSTGSPFVIKPVSMLTTNIPGRLANFNKFANYAWTLATASGGISNFASNKFTVDASSFLNDISGGAFSIITNANSIVLKYQAAPLVYPQITGVFTGGSLGVTLGGTGGVSQAYVLSGTTNLFPAFWMPLSTNLADTNGVFQFTDRQATNYGQRFYRLSVP